MLYIQSEINDFIDLQGWMSWLGDFNFNTCYYAEVDNNGAIADMSNHINWRGAKNITYQHTLQKYRSTLWRASSRASTGSHSSTRHSS
jgi:pectinesterase